MKRDGNRFMQLGYGRVSTNDRDTAAQVSALKAVGYEKIFREKASGGRWDRPELDRLLDQLRKGEDSLSGVLLIDFRAHSGTS
jgi:DNA invertase Pin-like site-specific DNA recombinase